MRFERKPNACNNAKLLRKNMTKEEKHLWYDFLNKYPVRFRRQEVIGNYIADFIGVTLCNTFRTEKIVAFFLVLHFRMK